MKNSALLSFFISLLFPLCSLCAAPQESAAVQQLRLSLEHMDYQVHSHGVELSLFQERMQNLEQGLAALKRELTTPASESALERRVAALEKANETLIADFKTLKTHLNETSITLINCQTQLNKIDKQLSSDIHFLKSSLHSMLALLQGAEQRTYIVQSGDSLSQIAVDHKTDTKTLKKLNNLTDSTIYPGQKLLLP
jgi:LysM repeat protein